MCNKIDINQSVKYLSQNGPLAKINPDFEERKSQLELVKNITQCFNENQIGVFEAGTGVGKSYAYLIPALLWAKENNQRVVISTGTINLQQQLAEKDIIQAQKILETNEKFLLLKGRQNYVCLRRLKDLEEEKDLFFEEVEELKIISEWVKNSETGSKSELTFLPSEAVWQRINSESDACMGNRCKFFEDCFVMKVRKAANEAKILIVNHHLLFSDIQLRLSTQKYDEAAVLPPYTRLIFDEAHGIEAAATSFFSESLNKFSVQKQLNLLYRQRKSSATGLLFNVHALSDSTVEMNEIIGALDQIKVNIQLLEDAGLEVLKNDFAWRLWAGSCFYANKLLEKFVKLNESILEFSGLVRDVLKGLHEKDAELPSVWETKQVLNRVEAFGLVCKNFITWEERPDSVFWIEKRKLSTGAMYLRFIETPLQIASTMNAGVFEPMETVVCVSATLQIANDFSFWKYRSGVNFQDPSRVNFQVFESPFPYEKNLLFSVVTDSPLPTTTDFQKWLEHSLLKLILASSGRALVLFTSYDSLMYAYNYCSVALSKNKIAVYKQLDDDRFRLLKNFKENTSSVLFATDSFWEGVDVPGESLSHVIIVKLPFPVPSDPVFQARSEHIDKNGGKSFMELSIPESVIKFKQGFGRLMRSCKDRGCVTVLDNRLVSKFYGSFFVKSVPKSKYCFNTLETVVSSVERFLDN